MAIRVKTEMPQDADLRFAANVNIWKRSFALRLVAIAAVVGLGIGVGGATLLNQSQGNSPTVSGQLSGRVALTENELLAIVSENNLVAYWSGSEAGALYSLVANTSGQVFVRYLSDGLGLEDTSANYRVVATYPQADAFAITQAAGNQANAISFVNPDGAQVFFSKDFPSNIYMAYPDLAYEIEIYDPGSGVALNLATTSMAIRRVG
jgi:hypothetical protein|tara:strand:+ start:5288 stop:5908 length:621 start_codon:yes stop_codon:yes gene_type:complete